MSKPNPLSKVLYSEMNEQVLSSGAKELEKAGFTVQTAIGRKAVQEALNTSKFDLVILGGTLSRDDRHHLPYMAKKSDQSSKVIVMHTDGSRHPYVDGNIDTGEDMDHLLRKISAVQQQPKAAAATVGR